MESAEHRTLEIKVRGYVQGVGFRYSCRNVARELGVRGWASNQPDGGVCIVASAPRDVLDQFLEWLKKGPPGARVDSVDSCDADELKTPSGDFEIR